MSGAFFGGGKNSSCVFEVEEKFLDDGCRCNCVLYKWYVLRSPRRLVFEDRINDFVTSLPIFAVAGADARARGAAMLRSSAMIVTSS